MGVDSADEKKTARLMDRGGTDEPTDGRTDPLIEYVTKKTRPLANIWEAVDLKKVVTDGQMDRRTDCFMFPN